MHVFIAGIMQGSREDHLLGSQDYRTLITEALRQHVPGVCITDPLVLDPGSVDYNLEQTVQAFKRNTALAAEADVLIAYLPQASMGTAIEMWTAHHNGTYTVAVTPLKYNWVVRVTADEVLPDLDALLEVIKSGQLTKSLERRRSAAAGN